MNNENSTTPRWLPDAADARPPSREEAAALGEVLRALRRVSHGSVQVVIQDSRVVQIDITEKRRL